VVEPITLLSRLLRIFQTIVAAPTNCIAPPQTRCNNLVIGPMHQHARLPSLGWIFSSFSKKLEFVMTRHVELTTLYVGFSAGRWLELGQRN
jgi:hypothetical protein